MASSLPDELVEEILVRLSSNNPTDLLRASLVCKDWRRVLSDRGRFLRRYRLHGRTTPPMIGYIQNRYFKGSSMQFVVPAGAAASPFGMPAAVDYSSWVALDCRHGRVLIHFEDGSSSESRELLVWDPITGSQQHLSVPSCGYSSYQFRHSYTGAVLCAKEGCDDHLDCRDGSFRIVFVQTNLESPTFACATTYPSLAGGAWSSPTPLHVTCNIYYRYTGGHKPSLVIGDAIYFIFEHCTIILKYDLSTHWLSEIKMPRATSEAVLMKAKDGGLGLVTLTNNSIHMWSRRDVTAGELLDCGSVILLLFDG